MTPPQEDGSPRSADGSPRSADTSARHQGPRRTTRGTTRAGVLAAFIAKDLRLHARDRFYVVVSVVGLVFLVGVFWLLPDDVDETLRLGIHVDDPPSVLAELAGEDGEPLEVVLFDSAAELEAAVAAGEVVVAGIDLPPDFAGAVAAGEHTVVRIILGPDAPDALRPAVAAMAREIALAIVGSEPPVTSPPEEDIVLGVDRAGAQLSMRDQLRPLFVFVVLFVEMFALGSLVATEVQQRTITAILATPARISDVLAAKTVIGTVLAFGQAVVLLAATGAATRGPLILAVALLLGAILVTAVGMIAGSTGRDFVGVVFWTMLIGVPLLIPAVGALFPGTAPTWIRALPSHGLVQVLVGTTAHGDGWAEAAGHLAVLAAWCAGLFVVGVLLLRRRVARL